MDLETLELFPFLYSVFISAVTGMPFFHSVCLQGNLDDVAVAGKIPRIHANSVRHSLSGSLLGYSASSFGQDNGGTRKIKEKECSVIEFGTKDNIMKIDCLSWGSKPNMKRAHTCSATYGEASQSTDGANTWQEKAGYFCSEDDLEHKRMKHYSEGHGTGSYRDPSIDGRSPFKVQPFKVQTSRSNENIFDGS
uniref:Uncharacterized protein n=1 Tax=Musa acuminata subsp. malaccensis TaxID=214687 RepID=A0A804KM28_MUSAM